MNAKLSEIIPIKGAPDGKGSSDPEVRQAWLDQRRGGVTATDIRDAGIPTRRRAIILEKVTGEQGDEGSQIVRNGKGLTLGFYAEHGNRREPVIAEWIGRKFGITPCSEVYAHGENLRHLASPDGITLDPFTGELVVGAEAALAEIKTSTKDLHPGRIGYNRTLIEVDPSSTFASKGYYTQMQWQMYVMNAARTLFVWEQHDGQIDPETGTFSPLGTPEWAWIPRDQKLIDVLVNEVAPKLLAEIDAARLATSAGELPPVGDLPAEHLALVADLLKARDAEAVAKAAKEAAWAKLQEALVGEGKADLSVEIPGFAKVTVSTSSRPVQKFDEAAARARAPKLMAQYEALVKRYTKPEIVSTQKLTITRQD